jgi:hypothetical protein
MDRACNMDRAEEMNRNFDRKDCSQDLGIEWRIKSKWIL